MRRKERAERANEGKHASLSLHSRSLLLQNLSAIIELQLTSGSGATLLGDNAEELIVLERTVV